MKKLHEYETPLTDGMLEVNYFDSSAECNFVRSLERKLALAVDALRGISTYDWTDESHMADIALREIENENTK